MSYAQKYADQILHRGRIYMEPVDFEPNWADKPRKQKFYPKAHRISLEPPGREFDGPFSRGIGAAPAGRRQPLGTEHLDPLLSLSYGLTGRRLAIHANTDLPALPLYHEANWYRGTASGGGLYPVAVYLVDNNPAHGRAGVYHYSPNHHAWQRVLLGDVTPTVRAAIGENANNAHGAFLILTIKYWQNAFKYNSFSFHAVTMDVGTILETWKLWAGANDLEFAPLMWFDEDLLIDVVAGQSSDKEGAFAVVPLGQAGPQRSAPVVRPAHVHQDAEISATSYDFDAVVNMHRDTAARLADRPEAMALADTRPTNPMVSATHDLPAPRELNQPAEQALRNRRSSFGRFLSHAPLAEDQLATILHAAASTKVTAEFDTSDDSLTNLYVYVNKVDGIDPGAYLYDRHRNALDLVVPGYQGTFLQQNYFLSNYNLEEAAAVVVPTVAQQAILKAIGPRGYRLINANVGAVSQATYTASAAVGVGCGAALGFDNVSFIEQLGLQDTGEAPLLIMMIGNERIGEGNYDYRLH